MALNGTIKSVIDLRYSKSAGLPAAITTPIGDTARLSISSGTAADQADRLHWDVYSLAATPTDLDLRDLLDIYGDPLAFAEIVWGRIYTLSQAAPLTIGGAGAIANAWTAWLSNPGTLTVRPKTPSFSSYVEFGTGFDPGFAVAVGNQILRLDPGAATFDVVAILAGRSS